MAKPISQVRMHIVLASSGGGYSPVRQIPLIEDKYRPRDLSPVAGFVEGEFDEASRIDEPSALAVNGNPRPPSG